MNAAGPLVLIVNDDPTARRMLDVRLRAMGYRVIMAATPLEALAAIARAVVLCAGDTLTPADLAWPRIHPPAPSPDPIPLRQADGFHTQVNAYRRHVLVTALQRANGNHTQAAKLLGLHRTYFLRLLQKLDCVFHTGPSGLSPSSQAHPLHRSTETEEIATAGSA
jgi:DNA-binding NtrC family response regulator